MTRLQPWPLHLQITQEGTRTHQGFYTMFGIFLVQTKTPKEQSEEEPSQMSWKGDIYFTILMLMWSLFRSKLYIEIKNLHVFFFLPRND